MQEALSSSLRKKQDLFVLESEKMLRVGQSRLKNSTESVFHKVQSTEFVKPVLEILWSPLLASFALVFSEQDEFRIIDIVLNGFKDLIFMTGIFGMPIQRYALALALINPRAVVSKVTAYQIHSRTQ